MSKKKIERSEVWWLGVGHSSRSRQPSFAPPTARLSVTTSSYGFGWHRTKACFITSSRHGMMPRAFLKEVPCDPLLARKILRRCADKGIQKRFLKNSYAGKDDQDLYVVGDDVFGIVLSKCRRGIPSEISLCFYSPGNRLQRISLHHGMTRSFAPKIADLRMSEIDSNMEE